MGLGAWNILSSLEGSYHHKEPALLENTQVEHIMPQTLNDPWVKDLGANYEEVHQTWLHTLGNLTLSAYNPELSKQAILGEEANLLDQQSRLNKQVAKYQTWNQESIAQRA